MAGRSDLSKDIADRVTKVPGWALVPTNRAGNGWKITGPGGTSFNLHFTPSDSNARRSVTAKLKEIGFLDAERKYKLSAEAKRKAKIEADRAANETKLKAAQSKALTRAQGEYAVSEELDIAWALQKHPAPAVRAAYVSPEAAEKLLGHNTYNRPYVKRTLREVGAALRSDNFLFTHEGIAFDTNAELIDGQNRLRSCVDNGRGAWFFVFVGMDPATRHVVGRAAYRTAAQSMAMEKIPQAVRIAGIVRMFMTLNKPYPSWSSFRPTDVDILDAYHADPNLFQAAQTEADAMVKYGREGHRLRMGLTTVGGVIAFLRSNERDQEYVTEFLAGVRTGYELRHGDARVALHDWVERQRELGRTPHRYESAAVFILAWNAHVSGNRATRLKWTRAEDFPLMTKRG